MKINTVEQYLQVLNTDEEAEALHFRVRAWRPEAGGGQRLPDDVRLTLIAKSAEPCPGSFRAEPAEATGDPVRTADRQDGHAFGG
jgi:hypothetical protein